MFKYLHLFFLFICSSFCLAQQSDFAHINFSKADNIAQSYKSKNLQNLNKITFELTKNLDTDIEKFRAIYMWVCANIANDYKLYFKNDRKRKRYKNDSLKLKKWNSKFQKILFKKLQKKKKTICTGYAYILKEMSALVGIKSILVNGSGRTSTSDIKDLSYANHTWNLVKIDSKWYLCDATWAAGTPSLKDGRFLFNYNDGYFLTAPSLFIYNHFPINENHSLLANTTPSFQEFVDMPLLYGKAYEVLSNHIMPTKMYHKIKQHDTFTFRYLLKESIKPKKIKLVLTNNTTEKTVLPKYFFNNNILTMQHTFAKRGFYDVHLYLDDEIIVTYTLKIQKKDLKI